MVNLYCFPNDQAYDKVTEDGIVESLKNGAKSISEATLNATTQGVESLQKFVEPETQQEPDREVHYFDDEAEAEEQDKGFIVLEEKKGIQQLEVEDEEEEPLNEEIIIEFEDNNQNSNPLKKT